MFIGRGCPLALIAPLAVTVGTPVTILGYEWPTLPILAFTLTFTSSDARALLPAPLVFLGEQARVLGTLTFQTLGLQTVRAAADAAGVVAVGVVNVLAQPPTVPVTPLGRCSHWRLFWPELGHFVHDAAEASGQLPG